MCVCAPVGVSVCLVCVSCFLSAFVCGGNRPLSRLTVCYVMFGIILVSAFTVLFFLGVFQLDFDSPQSDWFVSCHLHHHDVVAFMCIM